MGDAVRNAPEVLLADLLSGAVELERAAGPEEFDSLDGGPRADNEAVPYSARHSLWVEARSTEQPGS
jgi:hypothetical protein